MVRSVRDLAFFIYLLTLVGFPADKTGLAASARQKSIATPLPKSFTEWEGQRREPRNIATLVEDKELETVITNIANELQEREPGARSEAFRTAALLVAQSPHLATPCGVSFSGDSEPAETSKTSSLSGKKPELLIPLLSIPELRSSTCDLGSANLNIVEQVKQRLVSEAEEKEAASNLGQPDVESTRVLPPSTPEQPLVDSGSGSPPTLQGNESSTAEETPPSSTLVLNEEERLDPYATGPARRASRERLELDPPQGVHLGSDAPNEFASGTGSSVQRGTADTPVQLNPVSEENLNLLRNALNERVVRREIEPGAAKELLESVAPSLLEDPNLERALERARSELLAQGNPLGEPNRPLPASDAPSGGETDMISATLNALKEKADTPGTEASKALSGLGSVLSALGVGIPESYLSQQNVASSEELQSKTEAALEKKNALTMEKLSPLTNEAGNELSVTGPAPETLSTQEPVIQIAGNLASPNPAKGPKTNAPPKKVKQSTVDAFLDSIAAALPRESSQADALRAPASETVGPYTDLAHAPNQEGRSRFLAALAPSLTTQPGISHDHLLPFMVFLGVFGLTLLIVGLVYRRRQASRQQR